MIVLLGVNVYVGRKIDILADHQTVAGIEQRPVADNAAAADRQILRSADLRPCMEYDRRFHPHEPNTTIEKIPKMMRRNTPRLKIGITQISADISL